VTDVLDAAGDNKVERDLLRVESLSAAYGKITAIEDVSLHVAAGEAVGIVGHNGAGKTTLLTSIFGTHPAQKGQIFFDGKLHSNRGCAENIRDGMAYLLADDYVFSSLTVEENLEIAASNASSKENAESAMAVSRKLFPIIWERRKQLAGTLSGGERRMVGIAMVLAWSPRLLLLDEPSVGLAPAMVGRLFSSLGELRDSGLAMLCVEQNIPALLKLVDRVFIFRAGRLIGEEKASTLASRDEFWDLV
jgi:branched-chain amino acid transport system ATP-binding protein